MSEQNTSVVDGAKWMKVWDAMVNVASNWTNYWQECADWCLPRKDAVTEIRVQGMEKPAQRMIDTCVEANWNFASGFFSYMFPSQTVWAKLKHPQPELMDDLDVADYFENVSRMIHSVLVESNFAQEMQESLLDLGCFGTNCLYGEEDDESEVRFKSFTVAKFRIQNDNKGRVDTVGRELMLTARQMVQEFGQDALIEAELNHIPQEVESGINSAKKYKVVHIVRRRMDIDPTKVDSDNKPYASVYLCKSTKKILKEGGYDYMPYFIGKFAVGNDDDYANSPMGMLLSTARRTNSIFRSVIVSGEQNANPQWLVPDDDTVSFTSNPNRAGAIIKFRANSPNGRPERLPQNGDTGIAQSLLEMHEATIRRGFFNHLFRPLDEYRNMTAFEVNQRMTTDLMALTPFVNRYQDEVVRQIIEFVFYVLAKNKKLPPMPKALAENPEFEVEYVGKLSLATKNFEVMGAMQTLTMFADLAQAIPEMRQPIQTVDGDRLFRQMWYSNSASMNVLREPEVVLAEREAAAQQAEQQLALQNAQAMAKVAKDGSTAPQEGSPTEALMGAEM